MDTVHICGEGMKATSSWTSWTDWASSPGPTGTSTRGCMSTVAGKPPSWIWRQDCSVLLKDRPKQIIRNPLVWPFTDEGMGGFHLWFGSLFERMAQSPHLDYPYLPPTRVRRIRLKNLFASKRIEANLYLIRLFHIFRTPHLFASFAYIRLKIFASIRFEICT